MASLADTPDLVGFFSYSREDDEGSRGKLSNLREQIQEELRGQLGRTKADFKLWQDKVSIPHGELWEDSIKTAIFESAFFIPIITPTTVRSRFCKFEFETFLAREKQLGRSNLIFPIVYITVPALAGDGWRQDPLLAIIGSRQYDQWQNLRHLDASSSEVAVRVERLCENICKALQQSWLSPQLRQEAETRQAAEDDRRRQEGLQEKLQEDARQRAEEERRREDAEARRRLDEAAAEKARQDRERRELEKQAAWAGKKAGLQRWRGAAGAAGAAVVALLMVGGIWIYRTTTPAAVTSAVVQPDTQKAESPQAPARQSAVVQPDMQKGESPQAQTGLEDPEQAATKRLREDALKQKLLGETLSKIATLRHEALKSAANDLKTGDELRYLGLDLENMSDDLRARYKIKDTIKGVVIVGVDANSRAAGQRLSAGDVIEYIVHETILLQVDDYADLDNKLKKLRQDGHKSARLFVAAPNGGGRPVELNIQ